MQPNLIESQVPSDLQQPKLYWLTVIIIGVIVLSCVGGIIAGMVAGLGVDAALAAIGGIGIGSLGGILKRSEASG